MKHLLLVGAATDRPVLLQHLRQRYKVTVSAPGADVPAGHFHGVVCWTATAAGAASRAAEQLGLPALFRAGHPVTAGAPSHGVARFTIAIAVFDGEIRTIGAFVVRPAPPPSASTAHLAQPIDLGEAAPTVRQPDEERLLRSALALLPETVRAAGLHNGFAEVDLGECDGRLSVLRVVPVLPADPVPAIIEQAYGIAVVDLIAAIATGNRTAIRYVLSQARSAPAGPIGFVTIRADESRYGRVFSGLELGPVPLRRLEVMPRLANQKTIGAQPVAIARIASTDPESHRRELRHWLSAACIRSDPPAPSTTASTTQRPDPGSTVVAEVVDDLAGLARGSWPRLASASSLSVGWLKMGTALPHLRRLATITVSDGNGLAAGVPCWVLDQLSTSYDPFLATGLGARPAPGPVLLAGSRTGYSSTLLLRPGLTGSARRAALRALVTEIRRLADREAVTEAWFMHADDTTMHALADVVDDRALALPPVAEFALGLRSHEEWLASLRPRRRRDYRHLQRELDHAGATVRTVELSQILDQAAEMLAAHNNRFGSATSAEAMRAFLGTHARHLGSELVTFTYWLGDQLTALALAVEYRDVLTLRVYCAKEGHRRTDGLYFYLGNHMPIRYAAARGITTLELGPGSYPTKIHHGARLQARWAIPLRTGQALSTDAYATNRRHIADQLEGVPWPEPMVSTPR